MNADFYASLSLTIHGLELLHVCRVVFRMVFVYNGTLYRANGHLSDQFAIGANAVFLTDFFKNRSKVLPLIPELKSKSLGETFKVWLSSEQLCLPVEYLLNAL